MAPSRLAHFPDNAAHATGARTRPAAIAPPTITLPVSPAYPVHRNGKAATMLAPVARISAARASTGTMLSRNGSASRIRPAICASTSASTFVTTPTTVVTVATIATSRATRPTARSLTPVTAAWARRGSRAGESVTCSYHPCGNATTTAISVTTTRNISSHISSLVMIRLSPCLGGNCTSRSRCRGWSLRQPPTLLLRPVVLLRPGGRPLVVNSFSQLSHFILPRFCPTARISGARSVSEARPLDAGR